MLTPDSRILLLDALRPPVGFSFDRAVATTFTLDLETAMMVPLALAGYAMKDSPDPVEVLEAIRGCANKLDIFCQAGGIQAKRWPSDLIGLMEKSIHQVPRPKPGCLFHPKVWLLRYLNPSSDERFFRCLVLSRNLTQDRSWDIVLRLDTDMLSFEKGINHGNQNLNRFVLALPELAGMTADSDRYDPITEIAEELRRVWWELPEDVQDVQFWPFGLPRMKKPKTEDLFSGYRHLVVSPFISPSGMSIVTGNNATTRLDVISRGDELDRIPREQMPSGTYYQISPLASLKGDEDQSDDKVGTEQMLGDLHAKLYVVETNRRARVFVGSANATDRAFNGNVEILCEISGGATRIGIDKLLGDDSSLREILEQYDYPEEAIGDSLEELGHSIESYLFDLAGMKLHAQANNSENAWNVTVTGEEPVPKPSAFEAELSICPLNNQNRMAMTMGKPINVIFKSIAAEDITPFMILSCTGRGNGEVVEKQIVVCATLSGDPPHRLDDILARQIDTPEKFLRLIHLLLGMGASFAPMLEENQQAAGAAWKGAGVEAGLLELLVRTLAERPQALDALEGLVTRLASTERGRSLFPAGWDQLWASVTEARKMIGRQQ